MRKLILTLTLVAVAYNASAQFMPSATSSTTTTVQEPSISEPGDPTLENLQNTLKANSQAQALQQGLAIAALTGCTSKLAGKPQTEAFYRQMQLVGKRVEKLCQTSKPDEARQMVLDTMKTNKYNQVVMAANSCYAKEKMNLDMIAGAELAYDMENYARWIRDPALAQREMVNEDICK